mgnify:CR=1 FL=1
MTACVRSLGRVSGLSARPFSFRDPGLKVTAFERSLGRVSGFSRASFFFLRAGLQVEILLK